MFGFRNSLPTLWGLPTLPTRREKIDRQISIIPKLSKIIKLHRIAR